MTETAICPLCSKQFEGKTLGDAQDSVVGHVVASGGEHEGVGYSQARNLLSDGDKDPDDDLDEDPDDDDLDDDPIIDDGPPEAPTCPDCGSEDYYDATQLLRSRNDWDAENRRLLQKHERVCADCKEAYDP